MMKNVNAKMNLTLPLDFYEYLKQVALEEHLPISTFVKKYLLDNMKNNRMIKQNFNDDSE